MDEDPFPVRLAGALSGIADAIEVGHLHGVVPEHLHAAIDETACARFARAARHLEAEIERGRWNTSLPRCTADELLLQHALDVATWSAEEEGVDCADEAEAASDKLLMDDDVLLLFGPNADVVMTPEFAEATSSVNLAVADWWELFELPEAGREAP